MGEAPSPAPAPALWDWDYLDRCFARHRVCISFGLWICASSCWIAAHALLLYLRCAKRSGQDPSVLCAACGLLTSLCDTIGAILARQLTIQVFTGAYLAAVDLANFVFILFPLCGSKFKSNSCRRSRERKRRRQLRASVFALALPLSLGPGWALWAAVPKASGPIRGPQRRLLGSLLQDNTEILGYLLGGIATFGSWTSRIHPLSRICCPCPAPPISLQCRGKTFPSIHLWTRLLSALAGFLYASAIVAHDQRPEYLLRATPWLLTSLGRATLDLSIILLSWAMRSKMRRALGFASEAGESPDTQALLTSAEEEEENQEARNENSDWVPLTTLPHCGSLRTMAAISHYLELTVEPVQQAGCSATRLPGDGQRSAGDACLQEPPSYPPVQVIRACVSSSSSSEVSSINSDLEWDPEDVNLEGNKDNVELLRSQVHRCSMRPMDLTSDE
ncbi:transmembrane protein 44 isoform X4 [Manis javanica]|uniref:transmembrane protein 44 isoform X4 n=1 Tax=Manis javanica TaxID=9974 RepID=UPI003C6CDBA4